VSRQLGPEHNRRYSFCCAVDGCRSRATPPSLRFLGPKVSVIGQALRGSSEFHAWGDSNLYLRRDGDGEQLSLTVEHRAASPLGPMAVALAQRGPALALEVVDRPEQAPASAAPSPLDDRIVAALAEANAPMPFPELRERCRVRAATLYQHLAALAAADRIVKTDTGYRLAGG
jgi:hypothetical protein